MLKQSAEPEIKRIPLEEVCLNIVAAQLATNCAQFLAQMPEPPKSESVKAALDILTQVGAIEVDDDAESASYEKLTPLGKYLAKLPVDCRFGKMLVYGALFRCFSATVTIVAALSASKSPFVSPSASAADDNYRSTHQKFKHPNSDFLTFVNIWNAFEAASNQKKAHQFCRHHKLNISALKEISDGRKEYLKLIKSVGLLDDQYDISSSSHKLNSCSQEEAIVHSVVCAGLYPNIGLLDVTANGKVCIKRENDTLLVHRDSVNVVEKQLSLKRWLLYCEKFSTSHTVFISTTCFVHPFAIILFGDIIEIQHLSRSVIIDKTYDLTLAARNAMIFVKLREQMNEAIEEYFIEGKTKAGHKCGRLEDLVDSITKMLTSS
jgi:HrpA-like RNA helicase